MVADAFVLQIYGIIVSWTHVLLVILFIWKLVQLFRNMGSGGSTDGDGPDRGRDRGPGGNQDTDAPDRGGGGRRGREPAPQVERFNGRMVH